MRLHGPDVRAGRFNGEARGGGFDPGGEPGEVVVSTMTKKPRQRALKPRMAPHQARLAILRAPEEEFATVGFGGARADRIAARAGVNKALPFYYFGSKADLYDEVLKQAMERVRGLSALPSFTPDQMSPKQRLVVLLDRLFELMATDRYWLLLVTRELIDDRKRVREFAQRYLKPLVETAQINIKRDMKAGRIVERDPLDIVVSVLAEVFFYFLVTPLLEGLAEEDPLSEAALARRKAAVMKFIRRGLGGPKAARN